MIKNKLDKDSLSVFLEQNKDILLLKNRNNTVVAGPQYCLFKDYLKTSLCKFLSEAYPKVKFVELSLPSSVDTEELSKQGYNKNFELIEVKNTKRSLKPELFATSYSELDSYKHFFGTEVCYYSIGSSFRNEKSTKKRVIRSFQFEQLEFQFHKCSSCELNSLVENLGVFLSTNTHDSKNIILEVKKQDQLPFYSTQTIDVMYLLDSVSNGSLELSSLSSRNSGQIVELSIGVTRTFITSMIDSSTIQTKAGRYISSLNTKFTKKKLL